MQPLSTRQRALGLAGFMCLLLFILSYFVYHKPLTPDLVVNLGTALACLAAAGLLVILSGGAGAWLWHLAAARRFALRQWHGGGLPVLQAGIGMYLLALIWLVVGLLGGYRIWLAWLLLGLLLLLLRRPALAWLRSLPALLPEARSGFERLVRFCLGWMAALTLLAALAPPVKFDALVYHLAFPVEYIQAGRFVFIPHNMYWGWPQTGEMLYTWAALLAGIETAGVVGWMVAALALLGLLNVVKQASGRLTAWGAAAALMAGSSLSGAWSWAYVDWLAILLGVAWLAAWISESEDQPPSTDFLLLTGCLSGMAIGVKYTSGVLLLCGLAWLFLRLWRAPLTWLRSSLAFGMAAVAAALPWLVKNFIATGNPIYPLLFPAGPMTAIRVAAYQSHVSQSTWLDFWLLPWRITLVGLENAPGYASSIGPLLFGLPLAVLAAGEWLDEAGRRLARFCAVSAAAALLLWMILGQVFPFLLQARLYYAFFPLLAALAGLGLWSLQSLTIGQVRLGRLANALTALVLLFTTLDLTVDAVQKAPTQVLTGARTSQEYQTDVLGWFAPAMQGVRDLPPGSRTLLLFEARYLTCLPHCAPDEVLDRWLTSRHLLGGETASNGQILAQWRAQGFTHVLVHHAGVRFLIENPYLSYTSSDWQALDQLLAQLPVQADFGDAYRLYRLAP